MRDKAERRRDLQEMGGRGRRWGENGKGRRGGKAWSGAPRAGEVAMSNYHLTYLLNLHTISPFKLFKHFSNRSFLLSSCLRILLSG